MRVVCIGQWLLGAARRSVFDFDSRNFRAAHIDEVEEGAAAAGANEENARARQVVVVVVVQARRSETETTAAAQHNTRTDYDCVARMLAV